MGLLPGPPRRGRMLCGSRVVTLVAIATLALGRDERGAMFTLVDGVVLGPLRYPEPERLPAISLTSPDPALLTWSRRPVCHVSPGPRGWQSARELTHGEGLRGSSSIPPAPSPSSSRRGLLRATGSSSIRPAPSSWWPSRSACSRARSRSRSIPPTRAASSAPSASWSRSSPTAAPGSPCVRRPFLGLRDLLAGAAPALADLPLQASAGLPANVSPEHWTRPAVEPDDMGRGGAREELRRWPCS
jgi:hypothetical protein